MEAGHKLNIHDSYPIYTVHNNTLVLLRLSTNLVYWKGNLVLVHCVYNIKLVIMRDFFVNMTVKKLLSVYYFNIILCLAFEYIAATLPSNGNYNINVVAV